VSRFQLGQEKSFPSSYWKDGSLAPTSVPCRRLGSYERVFAGVDDLLSTSMVACARAYDFTE
jgi:hypothetical protein